MIRPTLRVIRAPDGVDRDGKDRQRDDIEIDLGSLVIHLDPYAIKDDAPAEVRMLLARALCWDELMRVAAERLAGESDDYDNWGRSDIGDQRDRLAFLEAVGRVADYQLRFEIETLKRDLAAERACVERMWTALGAGSSDYKVHERACDIRYGRGKWAPKEEKP
jgi:hypothetical protein